LPITPRSPSDSSTRELFGVRNAMPAVVLGDADPRLIDMLKQGMGEQAGVTVKHITNSCFAESYVDQNSIAGVKGKIDIDCWQVGFTDARGAAAGHHRPLRAADPA
jgi:hypothetical protein